MCIRDRYSVCLPGALEGVKYILIPDFSNFGFETVISAVGQVFYSMSLATVSYTHLRSILRTSQLTARQFITLRSSAKPEAIIISGQKVQRSV